MSESTAVNPDQALAGATHLTHAGGAMLTRFYEIRQRILDLNGKAPWGGDDVGKQFNEHYLGGKDQPANNLVDVAESLVKAVAALGTQVTEGVRGVVDVDDLTALWFGEK